MRAKPPTNNKPARRPIVLAPAPAGEIPAAPECEQAVLSCILEAGNAGSQAEVDALISQLRPLLFHDLRHRALFTHLWQMREAGHAVDLVMIHQWLKDKKAFDQVGGMAYFTELLGRKEMAFAFANYLPTLKDKAMRRWCLDKTAKLRELAAHPELTPDQLKEEFAEIYDTSTKIGASGLPMIRVISPSQARAYEPDKSDFMLAEGLVNRGMTVTIGGEPGIGKSRLATTLAVAGARGNNRWLNYPVLCKWKTLILQSENDANRLKDEFSAVPKDLDDSIKVSDMLSHGLAFDNAEFRRELRRVYDTWPFEMLVLDPWNDITWEEGQKDYKQAFLNIKSVFRGLPKAPALVIVAHLRKRGRDEGSRRKSGRELLHELSGSLALGSESRTVFVVQAVSSSMDDPRVVVEVAKANNADPDKLKEYGTRSAWKRANGAFESTEMDWEEFDNPGEPDRRAVTEEMLSEVFNGKEVLTATAVAKRLKDRFDIGQSTAYRAIGETGYLRGCFFREPNGKLRYRNGEGS